MGNAKAKKCILIGIDSMMIKRIDRFAAEGRMPNLSRLMKRGVSACAYPTMPTSTGPNWTTIITGADSATHGVLTNNFDSALCQAERIWQCAERAGKRSIILRYPGGWPPTIKNGIAMEAGGPANSPWSICYSKCYTTKRLTRFTGDDLKGPRLEPVILQLEKDGDALGADLPIVPYREGAYPTLRLTLTKSKTRGYDRASISLGKGKKPASTFGVGKWSKFITSDFTMNGKPIQGTYRFKLLGLSPDAKSIVLYRSEVYADDGFTYPKKHAKELIAKCGPYFENPNRLFLALGWFDNYFEEVEYHTAWLQKAAHHLRDNYEWDLFFTQCHSPDYAEHEWLGGIDPMSGRYNKKTAPDWWEVFARDYEMMDRHIGAMARGADKDTLVVVVSDHGHIMGTAKVEEVNALVAAGLIAVGKDGTIVPAKSRLLPGHGGFFKLNLKGREPKGIVKGNDVEAVCEEARSVLYAIRDSKTGCCPIAAVLRNHEALNLGFGGAKIPADLIVIAAPGYTENMKYNPHAPKDHITRPDPRYGVWGGSEGTHHHLPSVDWSEGTIMSTFIIAGPGIKRGLRRAKPVFLRDVAPTMAYLLGIPCPRDANGSVLYDIME
ncbi:MAG: alkaline phosphatase family protein [Planctomycetota bacterium]